MVCKPTKSLESHGHKILYTWLFLYIKPMFRSDGPYTQIANMNGNRSVFEMT